MKVVYNACYGGFGLSAKAIKWLADNKGVTATGYSFDDDRANPALVEVVEALGADAAGSCGDLQIEEIPDGAEYEIAEYDGNESVVPPRKSWDWG